MRIQLTVDWGNRLRQWLATLWSFVELVMGRLWRIARPYVPRTRPFNRYYQRIMRQEAQRRRRLFTSLPNLSGLDRATKRRLLPLVRHHGNRAAVIDVWRDLVLHLVWMSGVPVFLSLWFFAFADDLRWFYRPISLADVSQFTGAWLLLWPIYAGAYWLVFLLLVPFTGILLLFLPLFAAPKTRVLVNPYFDYWASRLFIIGWPVGVVTAYAVLYAVLVPIAKTAPVTPSLARVAFGGMVSGLGMLAGYLGTMIAMIASIGGLVLLFDYALTRREARLYPDTGVTLQLLRILALVAMRPAAWGTLEMKHELVARLEIVARCLQYDLPRRLQSDIATDGWLQQMTEQMAAAQRALKPWVLMPKADTREQFIARVADAFVHAATGEWDALARSEGKFPAQRRHWRARATAMGRGIVIALLPLCVLWGVQQSPLAMLPVVASYVTIGALLWLVLTLLVSLDPSFDTKVGALQDILQSIPFLSKWLGKGSRGE